MRSAIAALFIILACSSVTNAQVGPDAWTPPLPTQAERNVADAASWAAVIATQVLEARESWRSDDRLEAFALQAVRVGATLGLASVIKTAFPRTRPCATNKYVTQPVRGATYYSLCSPDDPDTSFYSAHTALAFSSLGGPRLAFALPLSVGTGGLRVAAGKHWLTDTLAGAAVGAATSRIRKR
jgi:membrane-associated phospholipid phosphatase